MTHYQKLELLRDFVFSLRRFEHQMDELLDSNATESQIYRLERTRDAISRSRGQVGHLIAELVIGRADGLTEAVRT